MKYWQIPIYISNIELGLEVLIL